MFCRKSKKILDADLRAEAAALAGTLTDQAGRAAEWVAPRVVRARREVARAARQAQERLEPTYSEYRARVMEDYLPRAQRAASAAQAAAQSEGTVAERAQRAVVAAQQAAAQAPVRKSRRALKTLGWIVVAGGAAAAAYVVWRRSQPVEDPWAEEYWADSTDDPASFTVVEEVSEEVVEPVASPAAVSPQDVVATPDVAPAPAPTASDEMK